MRLIFLSWAYPPMRQPRAIQVARLAAHLELRPLAIICMAAGSDTGGTERDAHGIDVTRIPPPPALQLLNRLVPTKLRVALMTPDPERPWAMTAARQIAAASAPGPEDVLVTFGQPMSDHLAGLALKRRSGIRWIAHFSDPWVDNPLATRVPLYRQRNLALERRVIDAADQVLFTSEETVDLVMAKYPPSWRRKVFVVSHAFDPTLYPPRAPASGPLILRHLGNFYGSRGPEPLFRALALLAERTPKLLAHIRVELIGDIRPRMLASETLVRLPPSAVRIGSPVDYTASLALMRAADLLVTIDAPLQTSVFLPSKLVDYIGARRPILGITPPGTAARLIRSMGGWVADPRSPETIASTLAEAVAYLDARREAPWGDEQVRRRFEAATVAAEFSRSIEAARRSVELDVQ